MTATTIRPAEPADLDALTALLVAQLREHGNTLAARTLRDAADGMLRRPQRGQFLVADDGGALIGFAALSFLWTLEHGGLAAWLDELYVVPERRGAGIGAALLQAAVTAAARAAACAVDLEIERGHARAAGLYRRAGFEPLPRAHWTLHLQPPAAPAPPAVRERLGGCFCGALRYRVAAVPADVANCHCTMCRRATGAPFVTWASVARSAFTFTAGTPAVLRSSEQAERTFCAACGTALTFVTSAQREVVDFTVASLDDPAALPPVRHIWTGSQVPWLRLDDDLPRHARGTP